MKREYCINHYEYLRRSGQIETRDPDPEVRFWKRFYENDNGCWIYTGAIASGYGRVHWDGRVRPVHHVTYEIFMGEIPHGLDIDHLCRERACGNPWHLDPVTRKVNLNRGAGARSFRGDQCINGHDMTPENTYTDKNGWGTCRACRKAAGERRNARNREKKLSRM